MGGGKLVPKHLEHERICQAKLVQNWIPGKRWIWPQPEYEDLLSIFPGSHESALQSIDPVLSLGFSPVPCQNWAIFWTPTPTPRTPRNMLLMECPAIAAGQASRGMITWRPHFGRDFA
eukprot:1153494-Pelagomonas_calceolata.AAC.6